MFQLRPFAFCLLALLTAGASYAQTANPTTQAPANVGETWSLQECADYALANNITIKRSEQLVRSNEALFFQSKAALLPSINGSASYNFNAGRTLDPTTQDFVNQNVQSSNLGVTGSLLLFQGGQQLNSIKQSRTLVAASQLDVQQSKNDVALNVVIYYAQVLSMQELLEIAKLQVNTSDLQVQRTSKLVQAGSLPETNLLDLKAQLAADRTALITAQNNLNIARLNLMQAMNLPATDNFTVEKIEVPVPTSAEYEKGVQEVYEVAEKTQPFVQSADLKVQSSRIGVAVARGAYFPSLSLVAGFSTNYSNARVLFEGGGTNPIPPNNIIGYVLGNAGAPVSNAPVDQIPRTEIKYHYFDQVKDNLSQFVGIRLNIPILNGWQTRTAVSRSYINLRTDEIAAQTTRIQLRQTLEQAYNNMRAAAAQYSSSVEQVAALELAFKATENRFNVGLLNSVDYALAKVNLDRARATLVQAKYDYILRTKVLDFYQNKPLSF